MEAAVWIAIGLCLVVSIGLLSKKKK
ncbi:hypothetical protein DNH61_04390 [Paenibacillus sambharensis]|uniref:LPXTG cell wall anchor domain-containing protein n=1 Tax=Paenibacillus sambharensis TaxID=1803190 RepID=A0A2W1LQR3_9BACL|nr:hypothetical protein DNH61_04390 [Paenibacillus sambharensis]